MNSKEILDCLNKMFPNPKCELNFSSVFELLIAVILSAQCTDKRVNNVTEELFKTYNKPEHFAKLDQKTLEKLIYTCGFYHNKAKSIIESSKDIISQFNGEVPKTLDELLKLRGVGRKTANVVLSVAYDYPAIAVDTHVFRVSNRLGIVNVQTVRQCEDLLMKFFEKKDWSRVHYQFVLFGRYHCTSRKPKCENCCFKKKCKFYLFNKKEKDYVS